jgi:hypothetical protein
LKLEAERTIVLSDGRAEKMNDGEVEEHEATAQDKPTI